ncbi:MAG: acyl carrier protein [Ruminococcaceae bacterium]|nr:acyl carrier protein [Oscillospiraceae bacterium]
MALSRNEIKEKLAEIMKMVMHDSIPDTAELREDSGLVTDLGLSSVGVLYVVIAIEEFFGIEFEDVGFGDFDTIGDVVDYIEQKQQA